MADIQDIVLIHLEDEPVSFARIERILPDHKKDWYQITLLMLQLPVQTVTWILKDAYINGDDFFMNGKKMRLELVESPPEEGPLPFEQKGPARNQDPAPKDDPESRDKPREGKIISFSDLKKGGKDPEPDIG